MTTPDGNLELPRVNTVMETFHFPGMTPDRTPTILLSQLYDQVSGKETIADLTYLQTKALIPLAAREALAAQEGVSVDYGVSPKTIQRSVEVKFKLAMAGKKEVNITGPQLKSAVDKLTSHDPSIAIDNKTTETLAAQFDIYSAKLRLRNPFSR
jgi:hypothetical protein